MSQNRTPKPSDDAYDDLDEQITGAKLLYSLRSQMCPACGGRKRGGEPLCHPCMNRVGELHAAALRRGSAEIEKSLQWEPARVQVALIDAGVATLRDSRPSPTIDPAFNPEDQHSFERKPLLGRWEGQRYIGGHLDRWRDVLLHTRASPDVVHYICQVVRMMVRLCGWKIIGDISAATLRTKLERFSDKPGCTAFAISAHVKLVEMFSACRLRKPITRGCADAYVAMCAAFQAAADERCRSRAIYFTLKQTMRLLHREMRSLKPESFALDALFPSLTIEPRYARHGKRDVQLIPAVLVPHLREWLESAAEVLKSHGWKDWNAKVESEWGAAIEREAARLAASQLVEELRRQILGICAVAPPADAALPEPALPPVGDAGVVILRVLASAHPHALKREQIRARAKTAEDLRRYPLSLGTISQKMPRLVSAGYAAQPLGRKSGWTMTERGFSILPRCKLSHEL